MNIIKGKVRAPQKVVIYGPEGIGKSTLASQFPGPIFIDTEDGTKHLDVDRLETPKSWEQLLSQLEWLCVNNDLYQTVVVDTVDWAEQLATTHICKQAGKAGIEDFGYGKGYTYLAEEFSKLLRACSKLIDAGMHVVVTAHAHMRKFEQPDEMGSYDRWEMKLGKKTAPLVKEWADMVLFANYKTFIVKEDDKAKKGKAQGGKRVLHTTHHPAWDAKNRHGLKDELPMDYQAISHCIQEKVTDKPERTQEQVQPTQPKEPKIQPEQPDIQPEQPKDEASESPKEAQDGKGNDNIPYALQKLMDDCEVELEELQDLIEWKGYYPKDTPFDSYDDEFVQNVLIESWDAVYEALEEYREVPF